MGNFYTPDSMMVLIFDEISLIRASFAILHYLQQHLQYSHHILQFAHQLFKHYCNKINLTHTIHLEDEYLQLKFISWNLIYMFLMAIMHHIIHITKGIKITIIWNIGIINIYKCRNLINKLHTRSNQVYYYLNKCYLCIKMYIYYTFKSKIPRNILGYLSDFEGCLSCKLFEDEGCLSYKFIKYYLYSSNTIR